ncbi:uncharacterized protein OCT59_002050 [Rhizophagus irregularis]|uniref:uncharacterized protein n=1 Tax=Rhizophagus irregularis TaxID=588596 RepID=UPI0033195C7C|nr:hypothetical protein OCT59_002050 [Rhizophagus irregularis]
MSEKANSKGKRVIRDEGTSEDKIAYISEKNSQEMNINTGENIEKKNNRIKKRKRKTKPGSFKFYSINSMNKLEQKKKRINTYNKIIR